MADAVEEKQHSRYSASGSEGWLHCAGKVAMEQGIPDTSSPYADEGSAAHFLGSVCLEDNVWPSAHLGHKIHCWFKDGERDGQCWGTALEGGLANVPEGATVRSTWQVNQEMVDHITGYVEFVRKIAAGGVLLVEQRVHFGNAVGREGEFGTSDTIIFSKDGRDLHLVDLKYGRGEVAAEDNTQLACYGLGALDDLGMIYDLDAAERVHFHIYQPRIGNISSWTTTVDYLKQFADRATKAIEMSEEALAFFHTPNLQFSDIKEWEDEYLGPSEKGCHWCKRRGDCPKLATSLLNSIAPSAIATADLLTDLDDEETGKPLAVIQPGLSERIQGAIVGVPTLDTDSLAQAFGAIPVIKNWIDAIEVSMHSRLMNGDTHPDYKLVQGRQGNRTWGDKEEAEKTMLAMRLKHTEMYQKVIISPTDAEKLLAKDRPRLWKKVQDLITRGEGKITVAKASDKRTAFVPTQAVDALPDLSDVIDSEATVLGVDLALPGSDTTVVQVIDASAVSADDDYDDLI
jgi:hypothetical protein